VSRARPPHGFRDFIFTRDRNACQWRGGGQCRTGLKLTLSHRLDRSRGGGWWSFNIELLCGSGNTGHHGWREDHPEAAVALGHTIPGRVVRGVYLGPLDDFADLVEEELHRDEPVDWVHARFDLLAERQGLVHPPV
jgi:hypothetical protein